MDSLSYGSFARTCRIAKRCGHLIWTKVAWNALWSLATQARSQSQSLDLYESDYDCVTPTDVPTPTPFHFRPIEIACLNFCMELLN
ncbi:unnamed protein product [Penicillium salamii]|nr:unnamed protein product [Penicillium salamii]